ncbi:restriction endonuclease [Streptomyces sp. NPDC095602]|uniref:restriction endonuclease n=1 Tax=Streptomyces sp. NPDC095602 TaxID=3155819 RepID=UPI003322732C
MDESAVEQELENFLRESSFDAPIEDIRPHVAFPSDEALSLYLEGVEGRPQEEVENLLWRMLSASTSKMDAQMFPLIVEKSRELNPEAARRVLNGGSIKRLRWRERTGIGDAWEGMTWVLEMLPSRPGAVVDALNYYLMAQNLPDVRIHAISDAIDIVRTRWIGNPLTVEERRAQLKAIDPRKFEALIAAWWLAMGYEAVLTPSTRDGGYDVHATRELLGRKEKVIIECKRYDRSVPVGVVRELNGVGDPEFAHARLMIVTTSGFTKPAKKEAEQNRRTELIDGEKLVPLLNEHLGSDWPKRLERITRDVLKARIIPK